MALASVQRLSEFPPKDNPSAVRKRPNSEGFEPAPYQDAVQEENEALDRQYTALMRAVVTAWMPKLTSSELKVLMYLIQQAVDVGDLEAINAVPIEALCEGTGLQRDAVIEAVKDQEKKSPSLLTVAREHRRSNQYQLNIAAILGTQLSLESEKPTLNGSSVGKTDSKHWLESGKPTQPEHLESGKPTQGVVRVGKTDSKVCLESENPTQSAVWVGKTDPRSSANKELIKQQQAAAAFLSEEEKVELQKISTRAREQIDGKEALQLKRYVGQAGLTLTHLRWFLRNEKFERAKSRKAVLFAIAKDFHERAEGIHWPAIFDESKEPLPGEKTGDQIR